MVTLGLWQKPIAVPITLLAGIAIMARVLSRRGAHVSTMT
jgi:hypothetical protein